MADPELDASIAAQIAAGELTGAATVAIRSYGQELLGYLRMLLRDEEAALETFAQLCENLWKGIASFRNQGSFRAWLYRLALHAAQDFRRDLYRTRGRRLHTSEISGLVHEVTSGLRPDGQLDRQKHLREIAEQLDDAEKTLVVLRLVNGLSWHEVAEVLAEEGTPVDEAAARKRFQRLRTRLRTLLDAPES